MNVRNITKLLTTSLPLLICLLCSPSVLQAQSESGYVEVNEINYYYEIHGEGEPLLLLHGGLGSVDMLEPLLPALTENRQIIGIDLHGHGRTELGNREISYTDMGNDMTAILKKLGYDKVDVMGYSMGGGVALRVAIQHPEIVRRLVAVSASFAHPEGTFPEIIQQQKMIGAEMAEAMKETPMYQSYKAVAPHPDDFPRLLNRMGKLMANSFNWSEEIRELEMPVMLVYGDSDMFKPEHIVEFYQLLGGGLKDAGWQRENMSQNRLAILPDLTHYEIFMAPQLVETALPFLNGESGALSWSTGPEE